MVRRQCTATTQAGPRCRADALPGEALCFTHSPTVRAQREESRRRGGRAKSNAARAAKLWVAAGRQIPDDDLPLIVKALIVDVREGRVEPGTATAIANLAKVAVSLHGDLELERRLQALEEAASANRPSNVRRMA